MSTQKNEQKNESNNVADLQAMMFAQMKRLSDPEADLEKEIKRGQALSSAGTVIINAAKVQIDAARVKFQQEKGNQNPKQKSLGNAK